VLYEINDVCKSLLMTCVSINQPSSQISETPIGYQIKMKCEIDNYTRSCLKPILENHNLTLKEESGFIILF
jgi:hypothetical protein